jgi:prepilin-type N-terminal cleavage/methylation domain-containing protein
MISLKRKQSGFTIVELLIVIVVIGILAALVVTTFAGIQKKARNTERETDIKAVHGQVEAYFAQNNSYPALAQLQDGTWRSTNLKGLDSEALKDPKAAATGEDTPAGTPTASRYGYTVTPNTCTTAANDCTGYTLEANLEGGGTFKKTNLN